VCERTVTANVVALKQPIWLNRLGATIPDGMMYALARDVVDNATGQSCDNGVGSNPPTKCQPGQVRLRDDKRPRPIVLRANEGDCLKIVFTNLLPGGMAAGPVAESAEAGGPRRRAREIAGNAANRVRALITGEALPRTVTGGNAPEAAEAGGATLKPPSTVAAGIHVQAMPWVNGPQDDGSYAGTNPSSLVQPGSWTTYTLFAEHEGSYLLYSTADDWTNPNLGNGGADGGTLAQGLFGAVNVQPSESDVKPYRKKWDSEWYRSQVTEQDVCLASRDGVYDPRSGLCTRRDPDARPVLDYQALYPPAYKRNPSLSGLPILNMLCTRQAAATRACQLNEIVHTDLTAIVTGPNAGHFPSTIPPADQPPALRAIAVLPDRLQPYREFTIIYHESFTVDQAFPDIYSNPGMTSLASAADNFGINYGMGGIVSEILANRLGVGPMRDCTECKYEEFFLSSWVVGDPAMVVDKPATDCVDADNKVDKDCRATRAKYPDDPSNVYHSYLGDHVRFRVLHGGSDLHHVHHQHAHQWLHTSNSPNGDYTDSQSIGPGSSFTMEMTYYGSGNLNQTVGDSIFHCHFYAHFASGMWSMWRVHDALETGTALDDAGKPQKNARALPDGEIAAGTPIPGIVPVPTLPMPSVPAPVQLADDGTEFKVQLVDANGVKGPWVSPQQGGVPDKDYRNPGYPFFIPGIAGRRAPHPPLDFAYACSDNGMRCSPGTAGEPKDVSQCGSPAAACEPLDGGLPRHLIVDRKNDNEASMPALNNSDFSKILEKTDAVQLAEDGTLVEKVAMKTHSQRLTPSCRPDGTCNGVCSDNGAPCANEPGGLWQCGNPKTASCVDKPVTYVLNGLGPKPGAPYADPCIRFDRNGGPAPNTLTRRYLAADVQLDAVFNKEGWHYPQQRIISLWGDVKDTLDRKRPPEPLFFRASSSDCIEYTLANLVPNVYELDDFQVRTPTDILGQHIHLVKFDVTSSDGAGNGWNYEDGTFAPNEVTERIHSINADGGLDPQYVGGGQRKPLTPKSIKFFGDGPGGSWIGAQATIQRWYSDPIYDNAGACSNNPDIACTLTDVSRCGARTATCDVSAGFCANRPQTMCTAATAVARCGGEGECVARHDRTLRTVFTHDHFGPSTHQQAGLYAGLVVEPEGSVWRDNQTGTVFGGFDAATDKIISKRFDGGPTTWQAVIETRDKSQSFREFLLELQDTTLTYQPFAVQAFDLAASATAQFAAGSYDKYCKGRQPWEPCGFCGNSGVCVDSTTGKPTATSCLVPVPPSTTSTCPSGQACQLAFGQLTACTPEHFDQCQGKAYDDATTQPGDAIKSCKLLSGVPGVAWASTPVDPPASPEIITFFGATNNFSFNYRNEPIYQRTTDPFTGTVLGGRSGDLAYAYSSNAKIERPNPRGAVCSNNLAKACSTNGDCPSGASNACQWAGFCSDNYALCTPANLTLCGASTAKCLGACDPRQDGPACDVSFPYKALTPGAQKGDPFTPLLRAYAGDDVQVRTLTGAHLNPHNFTVQGMNWLLEPSFVDSGWRNSEVMGISEHFELISRVPPTHTSGNTDYLYQPGAAALEQAGGNWGLLRAYGQKQADLYPLPQNIPSGTSFAVCPRTQPQGTRVRSYEVVALTAKQALADQDLIYNDGSNNGGIKLDDPNAILFFRKDKLTCPAGQPLSSCTFKGKAEPLVLRANAGDCIKVKLYNAVDTANLGNPNPSPNKFVPYGCQTPANCKQAASNVSSQVGMRPQLVAFDAQSSGGANVGLNSISTAAKEVQTAGPGKMVEYTWYAGNIDARATTDATRYIPIEFGSSNLMTPDVMNHYFHGLIGGLVIEPLGSSGWENAGVEALVREKDGGSFREFAVFTQDNLNSGGLFEAVNYGSELLATGSPQPVRLCQGCSTSDFSCTYTKDAYESANSACTAFAFTPQTPTFSACVGESVRFRVFHPGGINTAQVFEIFGHNWSEAPYTTAYDHCEAPTTQTNLWASQEQGTTNQCANRPFMLDRLAEALRIQGAWEASLNTWHGSAMGHGPGNHLDLLIARAGGPYHQAGTYMYRTFPSMHFDLGLWGWFQVIPETDPKCASGKPDKALKNQWEGK